MSSNGHQADSRNKEVLGRNFTFSPEVIDDIHIKSELGRYRMRGMAIFKKIPNWDDLTFLPGTLTRFVIEGYREKCETRTVIGPRATAADGLSTALYVVDESTGARMLAGHAGTRALITRPDGRLVTLSA